jgi:hypothetical protein
LIKLFNRGYVVSDFGQDGFALLRGDRIFIPGSEINSLISRTLTVGEVLASPEKYKAPVIKSAAAVPASVNADSTATTQNQKGASASSGAEKASLRGDAQTGPAKKAAVAEIVIDNDLGGGKGRGKGKGGKEGKGRRKGAGKGKNKNRDRDGLSGRTKKELVL